MRLLFISMVAAFLLYSVIAARNGPTSNLASRRRFGETTGENQTRHGGRGRIVNAKNNENPYSSRRRHSAFKVTDLPRSVRTPQRKFTRMTKSKSSFVAGQKSEIGARRRSSSSRFHQARRSFGIDAASSHLSVPNINENAIFLEPVIAQKPKDSFFGYSFGKEFDSQANDELGPLIGPVNFPAMGKNVYIRLMVSPDKETASHVTVHLVNRRPVEEFGEIHETSDLVVGPLKSKPLISGKKSVILALNRPQKLIASIDLPKNRFVDKSVHHFEFTPSKMGPGFFRVQDPREIHQEVRSHSPLSLGDPHPYSPAPNHHRLPIANRPADNLVDLPIYPPLSTDEVKHEIEREQSERNASAGHQIALEDDDDAQQSASSRHTSVSRNHLIYRNAWKSIPLPVVSEPELISNNRESPEPVFMKEIRAPDLSAGNVSTSTELPLFRSSKIPIIADNGSEHVPVNLRLTNAGVTPARRENTKDIPLLDTLYHPSGHTTSYRKNYVLFLGNRSGESNADNLEDEVQATASNTSLTDSQSHLARKNK